MVTQSRNQSRGKNPYAETMKVNNIVASSLFIYLFFFYYFVKRDKAWLRVACSNRQNHLCQLVYSFNLDSECIVNSKINQMLKTCKQITIRSTKLKTYCFHVILIKLVKSGE